MVTFRWFLAVLLLLWAGACDDPAPTSPSSIPSPPQPLNYLISGTVLETVNGIPRPVADQLVVLFIQETANLPPGMTLRGSVQYISTDSTGRYAAEVPRSRVFASASWGKRQPCVATTSVASDTILDVPVFPKSAVASAETTGPLITGSIYETTPSGRRPIRNAEVWVDLWSDAYIANTETDAEGRFYLCGVTTRVRIDVGAEGYQSQSVDFIPGLAAGSLEFELTR